MPRATSGRTDTDQEAMNSLQDWTKDNGFAVALRRTDKDRKQRVNGRYLVCTKGRSPNDRLTNKRKSLSQRENYPFKVSIRRRFEQDECPKWVTRITCGEHSYGAPGGLPTPISY